MVSLCIVMTEFIKHFCLNPGTIENTILIINCQGLSWYNTPYLLIREALNTILILYKAKTRAIFCLNVPSSFPLIWRVVRLSLDEVSIAKVHISDSNTHDLL